MSEISNLAVGSDSRQSVTVARQPILDVSTRVVGYEVLFRRAASDAGFSGDGDQATARVITDVMSTFDLDMLTHGPVVGVTMRW